MHGMRRGMCIHEMCAHCRQSILCLVREDTQNRQANCNRAQNDRHQLADIRPIFDRLRCAVGVILKEDTYENLRHIGQCQPTGEQEQNFRALHKRDGLPCFLQHLDIFHHAFVNRRFGDITVPQRDTADAQNRHQENQLQQRLILAIATNLIQI